MSELAEGCWLYEVRLEIRLEDGEGAAAWSERARTKTSSAHARGFVTSGGRRCFRARWRFKHYKSAACKIADLVGAQLHRDSAIVAIKRYSSILDTWASELHDEIHSCLED